MNRAIFLVALAAVLVAGFSPAQATVNLDNAVSPNKVTAPTSNINMKALAIGLVPPTKLRWTTKVGECIDHLGMPGIAGPICASYLAAGKLVLVWDWSSACPDTCPPADGYRVYPRGKNANATTVLKLTVGRASTMAAIDFDASPGGCYAVKAFKGEVESDESVTFCATNFTVNPNKMTSALSTIRKNLKALDLGLLPPTNLRSTSDPAVCSSHVPDWTLNFDISKDICPSVIRAGKLVLVWDWSSTCPSTCPGAEGYRVYARGQNANTTTPIFTTQGGAWTMAPIDFDASPGGCYAVKAFQGDVESDESTTFCLPGFTTGP